MTARPHFQDLRFQRAFETVLAAGFRHAADLGEALGTAGRIEDGDADSWLREWTATAGTAWASAQRADARGDRTGAVAHYLRAGTYYAAAFREHPRTDGSVRALDLWRRQRDCWDRAVARFAVPARRIEIPYERTSLPGYLFLAPGAAASEARPIVVLNNGADTATSSMWIAGGAAAAERGYHWMTFDGPGQEAALYERGLCSRPDWEAVLTPVLEALATREEVDASRIAVVGVGEGGFSVPRALSFEHRFAAAVADPGVVDVATAWTATLPDPLRRHLARGDQEAFDREMHVAQLFDPHAQAVLEARARPYGGLNGSAYGTFERVGEYRLGAGVTRIATPLLITSSAVEDRWPGQSRELLHRLRGPAQLLELSAPDGAGDRAAGARREARIFDWLDGILRGVR